MERFSDLDAMCLAADTPTQPMHVLATLVLDRSRLSPDVPAYALFQARLEERFANIEPLRRRLGGRAAGRPTWRDDEHIHLGRHLHHLVLPDGGGLEALAATVADVASQPLTKDRPLWETWFVEGFDKDRVAAIVKVHHCALDGVSGIYALREFCDSEPFPATPPEAPAWEPEAEPGVVARARGTWDDLLHRPVASARAIGGLAGSAFGLVRRRGRDTPLPGTASRFAWNRALTPNRSVAFTTAPLQDVKDVGRALGASVNDVLVAVCAGVLRQYVARRAEAPTRPMVAAIPVSEREAEHGMAGNHFSMMFYAVPVDVEGPLARVEAVRRSASSAKGLYADSGRGLLGNLATLAPSAMVAPFMRTASRVRLANVVPPLFNVIISNIRGPDVPLYVAGTELSSIFPMGPLVEGVGLGITTVSYRDELSIGFMSCTDHDVELTEMTDEVPLELSRLLDAACKAPRP
jgi:diacylglycerol O-acyltransferase / wax synthase